MQTMAVMVGTISSLGIILFIMEELIDYLATLTGLR